MDSVSLWRTAYASLGASLLHNVEACVRHVKRDRSILFIDQVDTSYSGNLRALVLLFI
jgi:hypothetical protein